LIDVPAMLPKLGLIVVLTAPVTDQLSVLGCPAVTFAGAAVKPTMIGALPATTVTMAVAVPKLLVAVRV
jgi:hypothetical protein